MLALVACAGAGGRAGYTAQQQTVDGLAITLERPRQIAVLQDYELFVTLADSAGKRIDGASVFMVPDMPAMKMSATQPLGEPIGDGQYRLKGVFTMEGDWQLVIHATVGGKEYVATFDQQVTVLP